GTTADWACSASQSSGTPAVISGLGSASVLAVPTSEGRDRIAQPTSAGPPTGAAAGARGAVAAAAQVFTHSKSGSEAASSSRAWPVMAITFPLGPLLLIKRRTIDDLNSSLMLRTRAMGWQGCLYTENGFPFSGTMALVACPA